MKWVLSTATVMAVVVALVLRVRDHEAAEAATVVALALLGGRIAVIAWGVAGVGPLRHAGGTLPWSRLLVPGIVWLEGIWLVIHEPAWAMPVRLATLGALELAIVVVAVRALLGARAGTDLPERRIARGLEALLPARIARVAAAELVIVGVATRFLFGGWRRAVPAGFTYHRHSGLRMMLGVLPLLAVGDVLLLELVVLPHAGAITKLVVHALSIYGLVWLVGLYATSKARPHRIADDRLTLHRGILGTVELPLGDIEAVSDVPDLYDDWKRRAYLVDALRADLAGDALLELRLARPATFEGILRDRTGTRVIVAVDDPAAFRDAINRRAAGGRDVIG